MKVVENAIIVPIFTMIIIALISVGIYMHDRIIIRNMVSQISIEYEKESDITARKELIKRGEERRGEERRGEERREVCGRQEYVPSGYKYI